MVGWHHWLNGHEFEQTPGDTEGQGSLACCSSWGCKELDTIKVTEQQQQNTMGGSVAKNPPAKQKIRLWSLGQEDALEKEMATHSSILAWEIPWTDKPGGLQSTGSLESRTWLSNYITTTEYHRLCGLQATIIYFSQFWRLRSSKSKDQKIQCLVRTLPDS